MVAGGGLFLHQNFCEQLLLPPRFVATPERSTLNWNAEEHPCTSKSDYGVLGFWGLGGGGSSLGRGSHRGNVLVTVVAF